MTVEEVIEILKQFDPSTKVVCYNQYGGIESVNDTNTLHWGDLGDRLLIFYNENKDK